MQSKPELENFKHLCCCKLPHYSNELAVYWQTFEFSWRVTEKMTSFNERIVQEELNNDTESQMHVQYDDLRMSKLGFRIRLARAINMLGANGLSLSLWGFFIAILAFLNKIEVFNYASRVDNHIFGLLLLLVSTIYLFMFFFMVMKNKEKNLSGVTNILRLICSFNGVVMLFTCLGTILKIILDYIHHGFSSINLILLLIVPYTIIIILLLYGITNGKSWYVAIYIAFALSVMGLMIPVLVVIWAISVFYGTLNYVLYPIILIPVLIYKIGMFIALHSVLLDREMGLKKLNSENSENGE